MKTITVPAEISSVAVVTELVEEESGLMGLPMKGQMQLNVVVDEILANIASYAYPDKTGTATVDIFEDQGCVCVRFSDEGLPYDPLKKEDPDITLSADEREASGLGIYMVKKLTDRMEYHYEQGMNVLTVWKKIGR